MSASTTYSDSPTPQPQPSQYQYQSFSDHPQTSQATTTAAASSSTATVVPQTRQAAEDARKDRTLAEFLLMLDDYEPLIPNEVTDYYLQRVGFECEDVRLKRLLSLAAQKFVSDYCVRCISTCSYTYKRRGWARSRDRVRSWSCQGAYLSTLPPIEEFFIFPKDKTRTTLTMDDLSAALAEYGINARKPEFYM
ncbi:transcription initiation factor TFIID 23-30kDa subunit-domain-containing protein [Chiua virens]|nr:transcription initiation factor TFIID 23-30kDa subunit-domain-containing protein [Chiua virens]